MAWQVQEAKQRFSELVRRAMDEGPQTITRHGEEVVIVLSVEDYHRLSADRMDFKEFLLSGPDLSLLEIERSRELPRDIDL